MSMANRRTNSRQPSVLSDQSESRASQLTMDNHERHSQPPITHKRPSMNIQSIPVDQLHPAPYNPRKPLKPGMPGYRRLERSLREFGLVQPLVWNKTTGHVV